MPYHTRHSRRAVLSALRYPLEEYRLYWNSLRPSGDRERYRRWLFAYASVHSSVGATLALYRYLITLPEEAWSFTPGDLWRALSGNRVGGLYAVRATALWHFNRLFWDQEGPAWFGTYPLEDSRAARDRIAAAVPGLGLAKTAFALELLDPEGCTAVCLDRHLLRLYGLDDTRYKVKDYYRAEAHWAGLCQQLLLPPALVRHAWWDRRRQPAQSNTRYWSSVLETSTP